MRWWRLLQAQPDGAYDVAVCCPAMLRSYELDITTRFGAERVDAMQFYHVAFFLEEMAQYTAAEAAYRKALQYSAQPSAGDNEKWQATRIDILTSMARLFEIQSKLKQAETALAEASAIPMDDLSLARVKNRLGVVCTKSGSLRVAEEALAQALQIRQRVLGASHSRTGQTLKHMISLYEALGDYSKAEQCGQKALAITEDALGPTSYHVSSILTKLGSLYNVKKEFTKSESLLKRALQIREEKYGRYHPFTAEVLRAMGNIYVDRQNWDLSEEYLTQALTTYEKLGHPEAARTLTRLGELYTQTGRLAKAEDALLRAVRLHKAALGPTHSRVAQALKHLMTVFEEQHKYAEGEAVGQEALEIHLHCLGTDHYHTSSTQLRLGRIKTALGKTEEAETLLRHALRVRQTLFGSKSELVGEVLVALGELHVSTGNGGEAEAELTAALAVLTQTYAPDHWRVTQATNLLSRARQVAQVVSNNEV
eukprot:TRINITY_DN2782_c0_g1_i2.p1 TRINITY_DN2782_c0_g1~~TRINITY_DN2782_c0_g1_i2.p1  ORF type:complete len:481 (-),score=114.57 TRINITY_DN2782_c0_g1_i2:1078-2520(-)